MTQQLFDTAYIQKMLNDPNVSKEKKDQLKQLADFAGTANNPGSILERTADDKILLNFAKGFLKEASKKVSLKESMNMLSEMLIHSYTKEAKDILDSYLNNGSEAPKTQEYSNDDSNQQTPKQNSENKIENNNTFEFNNSGGSKSIDYKPVKQTLLKTDTPSKLKKTNMADMLEGVETKTASVSDSPLFPLLAGGAVGAGGTLLIQKLLKNFKKKQEMKNNPVVEVPLEFFLNNMGGQF